MTEEYEVKRRDILEGASEVFVRRGFAAGTTKEIAAEVGLSQPAIYHYVGSKADLLREIALQVDRDMLAALDTGMASSDDPAVQLRNVLHAYTAAVVHDRRSFAVFWQELHSMEPGVREKIAADERDFVVKVGGLIQDLQERGQMPEGPPLLMARAILSMPSWMYHWYRPSGSLEAKGIADIYCRLIGLDM
ncbi:transcriptional regulator, TetR family [Blastococcus aggregatus]|uniref:Transcriptional regulator, TetR family n=1 Tax=Blastococcus aggregatus TaxID=38502 RepID=A0A285V3P3_9ACTN|nr:TetR/AcrR family transcriptional regulator [Blastococcus aggregatus]SOC48567.1 transcriptional regulator, TetR family [Blastococcus aggregatus]